MMLPRTLPFALLLLVGCQGGPLADLSWTPFPQQDRTSYETPKVRMQQALAMGEEANGQDTPEQQAKVVDLARRIQTEPDPLVRESILSAIARFETPLASQVLVAALADGDPLVRLRACRMLGKRGDAGAVAKLGELIRQDEDLDVRIEATRALGSMPSPETTAALVAALESDDPAVQFAGVSSMKQSTGKDLGGDVRAYLAFAKGESPVTPDTVPSEVASRARGWLPF